MGGKSLLYFLDLLQRAVTCHQMLRRSLPQQRTILLFTSIAAVQAAVVESTVPFSRGRIRQQAVDRLQHTVFGIIQAGNGIKQSLGIGVARLTEQFHCGAAFHHTSGIHYINAVGIARHDTHVMRHNDDSDLPFHGNLLEHFQQLRLNSNIKRGSRFVRYQDLRLCRKRHGDHNTLTHAAGKLLRIVVVAFLRVRDPHRLQHFDGSHAGFLLAAPLVLQNRLRDLIPNGQHRIERCHRFLKNHANTTAADRPDLTALIGQINQVLFLTSQVGFSAHNLPGRVDKF